MNTNEAEQNLQALQAELATLPGRIKSAVDRLRPGEVRALKARQTELVDEVLAAEMALVDARLDALPTMQELSREGRRLAAELKAAEAAHHAAVERLIAVRTVHDVAMHNELRIHAERDSLLREKAELELRLAIESGEKVFTDVAGNRVPDPATLDEAKVKYQEPIISHHIFEHEIQRLKPSTKKLRP